MQLLCMYVVFKRAGMKWILHLGVDEMLFPGGAMHSRPLASVFNTLGNNIDVVVFPRYEGVVERDDVVEPFVEVTLFKRSPAHVNRQEMIDGSKSVRFETGRSPYFLGTPFGLAAARLQRGLRPDGPHRWTHSGRTLRGLTMEEAVVLHYPYAKYADLKAFKDVCSCQMRSSDLARCFTNEFDRAFSEDNKLLLRDQRSLYVDSIMVMARSSILDAIDSDDIICHVIFRWSSAFTAAKTLSDGLLSEWFRDYIVWSNRSVLNVLIKRSIFVRIQLLQVIIDGLRHAGRFAEVVEAGEKRMEDDEQMERLSQIENRRKRSMTYYHRSRKRTAAVQNPNVNALPTNYSTSLVITKA